MKKTALILATAMAASFASAGSIVDQFNEKEIGTLSGHLQGLSMYRDFENAPAEDYAHSTTLGIQLDYLSPEKEGWKVGASYVGVGVLDGRMINLVLDQNLLLALIKLFDDSAERAQWGIRAGEVPRFDLPGTDDMGSDASIH